MNGITSRWVMRENGGNPDTAASDTAGTLVDRVLAARGFIEPARVDAFLEPRLTQLHDPSLLPNIDRGAKRILEAAANGEVLVIYGDYDVDGITATAILYHTLITLFPELAAGRLRTYVPHRIDEGYGLNEEAVRELAASGVRVIVSVDCGVTAMEPARIARSLGVDLIITDHHNLSSKEGRPSLPDAFAVVHPRLPGSAYPFEHLSGAGVAYKLAWRLFTMHAGSERLDGRGREQLVNLLAFAALGTIADIVPLVGENRVIARFGLVRIRHSPYEGLRALVTASGLDGASVGEMDVGFRLGPRLNAAGRLGHAADAVELFTTARGEWATELAKQLTAQNDERRAVEAAILDRASEMTIAAGMDRPDRRAIVLAHEEWHPGVVGIVCSRLVERFGRPVILMQRRDGECHGSARSIDGFNLHAGLAECGEHLGKFGGHDMAAGLQLAEAKLGAFTDAFMGLANRLIDETMLRPAIRIDCSASLADLSPDSVSSLDALAPFGRENPPVNILMTGLRVRGHPALMGRVGKHLSMTVGSDESAGSGSMLLRLVGWDWGRHRERLASGMKVDVVLRPRINEYRGRVSVEGEIRDIAIMD